MKRILFLFIGLNVFALSAARSQNFNDEEREHEIRRALADLTSPSADERRRAAEDLGHLKALRSIGMLLDALSDNNQEVRKTAAYSLGLLKANAAVGPLIIAVERDAAARAMAIRSLGMIADPKAVDVLGKNLSNPDPMIVVEAALALGGINDSRVNVLLIKALPSSDDYGCQAIINVLAKRRAEAALPTLITLIKSQTAPRRCRLASVEAVGRIQNSPTEPILFDILVGDYELDFKAKAIKALGDLHSKGAYSLILNYLNHSDSRLREAAVAALAGIGDKRAVPYLQGKLNDDNPAVRDLAFFALSQLGADPKRKSDSAP